MNGTLYSVRYIPPKTMLKGNIEDSIVLEQYDVLYKVDSKKLIEKIDKLTEFQAYVVIHMALEYLKGSIKNPEDNNSERLKKTFLIRDIG